MRVNPRIAKRQKVKKRVMTRMMQLVLMKKRKFRTVKRLMKKPGGSCWWSGKLSLPCFFRKRPLRKQCNV